MKKKIISIVIPIVIILVAIVGYFALKEKTLKSDSEEVLELYSYMGSNNLSVCNGLVTYSDKEISIDTLNDSEKLCLAYSLISDNDITKLKVDAKKKQDECSINDDIIFPMDEKDERMCNVTKFETSKLKENYLKIFGKELTELSTFNSDTRTECISDGEFYYCGALEEFTITIGSEPKVYRSIEKVVDKGDTIEIYDYFIRVINNICFKNYTTDEKNDKCTSNFNSEKVDYKFLKKNGTHYKHTYEKDDKGNYHWVKSEPIK